MTQHINESARNSPTNIELFSRAPWPTVEQDEIDASIKVLKSGKLNYWTGSEGRLFEDEFAAFTKTKHAIALANGTLALELALYALDVGPGDEVIVPSRTFIASASCAVARGARPVVADVDRDSQVITVETIRAAVTPRTKAIVAVHLAGWPCDMDPIMEFARERGISVIEDCAQAHGAEYKGRPIGSIGDISAFSFCQDKILTTAGEGGMLVTNCTRYWDKAWRYKDHGKTPDAFYKPHPPSAQFRWLHESFGSNFRMIEVQSAIGRLILKKLPAWVESRRRNANHLMKTVLGIPQLRTPVPTSDLYHSYYKFYTFVRPEMLNPGWDRDRIVSEIRKREVPCLTGSCSEIYLETAFPPDWKPAERLPVARELGETSVMFLVHPTLTEEHINATATAINEVMHDAAQNHFDRKAA